MGPIPRSLRAGIAALVSVMLTAAALQPVSLADYRAIVSQYRDADALALDRTVALPLTALEAVVESALQAAWPPAELQAAAMLHTDVAVRLLRARRLEEAVGHINLASRLIDATIEASADHLAYAARWYAFASAMVHIQSKPWGMELEKRARDRFAGLASADAFEALRRGRSQELVARTGARGRVGGPRVNASPEAEFEHAIRLDPQLHEAWLHLGRLRMSGRDPAAAADALRRAAASPERRIRYLAAMFLGAIAERDGAFPDAERLYRTAEETYPSAQSARLALAHLLSRTGRETEARAALDEQVRRPPSAVVDPLWTYYAAPDELLDATLRELRIEVMR